MDVKYAEPGVPFVSIALAVAMTWVFFELAKPLARVPVLSVCLIKLGDAAMVVMFLHQYVHWTMRFLGVTSDGLMVAAGVVVPFLLWLLMKRSTLLRAIFLGDERSQRSIVTMTQWPGRWGRSRA
ncbi:MAG: hypothetical protein EOO77_29595 [Oxalobacteraceae bacterium]|nr:MAG: hypothetical protein EOO77_29595 [Oxalobacteraceae bacterium]